MCGPPLESESVRPWGRQRVIWRYRYRSALRLASRSGFRSRSAAAREIPPCEHSCAKSVMARTKTVRICSKGHRYQKSSDCPICPICEAQREPAAGFLSELTAPARRALEGAGITTLAKLSKYTVAEVLALHGMGPTSIPKLKAALAREKLSFQEDRGRKGDSASKGPRATRIPKRRAP